MSKDDVQSLMMGSVLVVLSYAMVKHFQRPAAPGAAARPVQGPGGTVQNFAPNAPSPYTGSPFTVMQDLLSGRSVDIGAFEGANYLNAIADPMISGNGGRDSVYLPGAPWYVS